MAKTINITFEGVTYTLEFTRKSIKTMESRGFKFSEISDKPVTMLPALFAGAFLAHHRFVEQDVIEEIFARLKKKEELIGKLSEMYADPLIALMDDPEENEGNLEWGSSW